MPTKMCSVQTKLAVKLMYESLLKIVKIGFSLKTVFINCHCIFIIDSFPFVYQLNGIFANEIHHFDQSELFGTF